MQFKVLVCLKLVCSAMQRVDFMHTLIYRELSMTCLNDQRLINLYESAVYIQVEEHDVPGTSHTSLHTKSNQCLVSPTLKSCTHVSVDHDAIRKSFFH